MVAINGEVAFQHISFLDVAIGNVFEIFKRVVVEWIMNQGMVAPIVDVEASGALFGVDLER